MLAYEEKFVIALIITVVIETAVIFLLNYVMRLRIKTIDILFAGFLASFATLPYLWFVIISFVGGSTRLYLGEVIAFLIEIIIYKKILKISWKMAILISILANLASYGVGLVVF